MNGNIRRRQELIHPENSLTTEDIENRKEIAKNVMVFGKGISMTFMILGAILIAFLLTNYSGVIRFYIAFFGILLDITAGVVIAYNIGNKMQKVLNTNKLIV